jgi:PE-PPE domain/Histidine kinase
MGYGRCVGRVGALAVATRMTVSIGVAVLVVMSTVVPVSPAVRLAVSSAPCTDTDVTCALIMGTSGVPTPDDFYVESVKNQFIAPTHPGQHIEYVKVTTPEGMWPIAGLGRLVSLLGIGGSTEIFGPGGPAWDVPWWNLTGLFDLTLNQSILQGVTDLEQAIAEHPNDHLVIYGYSQSALIANREKQRLAEQYPAGTEAPDIDFVLSGDPNLPNGGFFARFPGLYIPILDWTLNGPAPTDTQFDTVEITRQYDFMADFPLYPLNGISLLNAFLGFFYVHTYPFDVSLAPDPTTPPPIHSKTGDTDYYFFPTEDLPLFGPLRTLGVPESFIDVVEPFFRVLVELGYDRSIPPGEPTPARLIPTLDLVTVAGDLVNAVGEGINNAAALIGSPAPLSIPAARATADQDAAVEQVLSAPRTTLNRVSRDVGDGVSQVLIAVRSQLPATAAVTRDDLQAPQRTVGRELAATRDQMNETIGAVKSVIGNGRTIVRSASGDNRSNPATTSRARKTPVRDTVTKASSDIKKVVTKVSDSIQTALSGGKDDDNNEDGGEGAAQ